MAPKRDIRDFFKPASTVRDSSTAPQVSTPYAWPARRATSLHSSLSTPKAVSTSTPAKEVPEAPPVPDDAYTPRPMDTTRQPTTSQTSTNSSESKRVVVNGHQVVQNSDSDTDEDELLELNIGPKRPPPKASPLPKMNTPHTRPKVVFQERDSELRRPPMKRGFFKPTLSHLVKIAKNNVATEQKIAEGKAELDKPVEEATSSPSTADIDEERLAGVVSDDEDGDNARRLYLAMQRTNTSDVNYAFHMFSNGSDATSTDSNPFPSHCLPRHRWVENLRDPGKRDQAFLSGFAQQVFQYQALPEELGSWIIDQISRDQSDGLKGQYLQLVESHSDHLKTLLNSSTVMDLFTNIGAKLQGVMDVQEVKVSIESPEDARPPIPPSLKWIVKLMQSAAPHLSAKTNGHALWLLFHLCFDESVISDAVVLYEVQEAIETLLCSISTAELTNILDDLVARLTSQIIHPVLRMKLVRSLPSRSPLTASFQRHLALSFVLYPHTVDVSLQDSRLPSSVHDLLQSSPNFKITKKTDYTGLAARISLLDIGIGPGLASVPFRALLSPLPSQEASVVHPSARSLSNDEITFNKQVDGLVTKIKLISNDIVEAGAMGDLTRLDAKAAAEKLYLRLEHAVRVGGRKRVDVFGLDDTPGTKRVMGGWLKKGKVNGHAANSNGELNVGSSEDDFVGVPEE
ncbi:hypothetical protein BDV96DRAFT_544252 [Lophiotrema nucula]|uniref:Uncharacterized protein n=1 Tax=Lophiotrema nucula TaxID=690887 RepID=A0A6A5ZCQ5_9PLEO|nr:hypothetical protein BDV96DRAFT_544252 [Lophiotrema nucula]